MFYVKYLFLAGVIGFGCVDSILTKANPSEILEKKEVKKTDSAVAQSIDRDYIAGYEDNYGHGNYGLSAHAHYGFPEVHEGYGGVEGGKYHHHHSEDYHHHHYDHEHHKHYGYDHHKALAIKSLLVPLAGVALLGAAAAFVSNPILLQLGVISGTSLGRKKRDVKSVLSPQDEIRLNELKLLEKFMGQIPKQSIEMEEKKMLANYLSCTGVTMKNNCIERLACELHSKEGTSMEMEGKILRIVVNEILDNDFVADDTKNTLSKAIQRGKMNFGCEIYKCQQFDNRNHEINYSNYTN